MLERILERKLTFSPRRGLCRYDAALDSLFHPYSSAIRTKTIDPTLSICKLPFVSTFDSLLLLSVDHPVVICVRVLFRDDRFSFDVVTVLLKSARLTKGRCGTY